MYITKIYNQDKLEEILEFIKEHSFCTLINQTNGKLCATHIPLLLEKDEDKTILHGHISKLNTQSVGFEQNDTVLFCLWELIVIFRLLGTTMKMCLLGIT